MVDNPTADDSSTVKVPFLSGVKSQEVKGDKKTIRASLGWFMFTLESGRFFRAAVSIRHVSLLLHGPNLKAGTGRCTKRKEMVRWRPGILTIANLFCLFAKKIQRILISVGSVPQRLSRVLLQRQPQFETNKRKGRNSALLFWYKKTQETLFCFSPRLKGKEYFCYCSLSKLPFSLFFKNI